MIIRDQVIDAFKTRLSQITLGNGYSREVGPTRIYAKRSNALQVAPPGIILMQAEELPREDGSGYRRFLKVMLVFVDKRLGSDPDQEASSFLAEIQRAVKAGGEMTLTVAKASGGTGPTKVNIHEKQNVLNGYGPEDGKIYGDVTYELDYRTSWHDPSVQGML